MRIFPPDRDSMPPRWLIVSADSHPAAGGIGAYVWNFVHVAVTAGWEVHLLTRPDQPYPPGAIVHEVSTPDQAPAFKPRISKLRTLDCLRPYRYGLWSLAVAERLAEIRLDVDAIEFPDSCAEGVVSLTSSSVRHAYPSTPMFVHAHAPLSVTERAAGLPADELGRDLYHEWERVALQCADGVLASSAMIVDALQLDRAITRVPPPLAPVAIAPIAQLAHPRILFVGTAHPGSGLDVWMRSLNDVLSQHRTVEARIVGRDVQRVADGGSSIEKAMRLARPDVRDRITWVGPCDQRTTAAEIGLASIVVVPSRFDSFSYAGAEALMQGRPVIVTDCVGLREYSPDLPAVPAGDDAALAAAQRHAINDLHAARTQALQSRSRLVSICAPGLVIASRLRALNAAQAARAASTHDGFEEDGMITMRNVLAQIESDERGRGQTEIVCA